jgi:uncharacterized protein YigA (DUF484 family)
MEFDLCNAHQPKRVLLSQLGTNCKEVDLAQIVQPMLNRTPTRYSSLEEVLEALLRIAMHAEHLINETHPLNNSLAHNLQFRSPPHPPGIVTVSRH